MTSPKFPYLYELDQYFRCVFAYAFVQNLIDLAGSESSKTETTGLRRKEGSYINKSLLTLGTVSFIQCLYFLLRRRFVMSFYCTRDHHFLFLYFYLVKSITMHFLCTWHGSFRACNFFFGQNDIYNCLKIMYVISSFFWVSKQAEITLSHI